MLRVYACKVLVVTFYYTSSTRHLLSQIDCFCYSDDYRTLETFTFDVLGIRNEKAAADNSEKLAGVVNMLIGMRDDARANKNWALSDEIRDKLLALGIQLKDGKEGTSFNVY